MLGILGEDPSDTDTLKILARRILNNDRAQIRGKGYGGCGELLKKGARDLIALKKLGCEKFVVCVDADKMPSQDRYDEVESKVVSPSGLNQSCCIVVPVEEMEAWILADMNSVAKVITGWQGCSEITYASPENIRNPKEELELLSRGKNSKPRYSHATHNVRVASYLDINKVALTCPSFRVLRDFLVPKRKS